MYRTRDAITLSLSEKCLFMLLSIVKGLTVLLKVIHAFHSLLVLLSQSDPSKLSGRPVGTRRSQGGEEGVEIEVSNRESGAASRYPRASRLMDNVRVPKGLQDVKISTQDYGQHPSAFSQLSF